MTTTTASNTHDRADDDGIAAIVAHLRGHNALPDGAAAERIMASIRQRPAPQRSTRAPTLFAGRVPWYTTRMLAAAVVAIVIFGVGVVVGRSSRAAAPAVAVLSPSTTRFVLAASDVRGVAVVGDFNGWDRTATPMKRDAATGQWAVELPLSAGRYTYAFVVDGGRWVADPAAPLAPADDYGQRNSVLLVNASYTPNVTR